MNDLYYKLNTNPINIYTYLNDMLSNMEILLNEINKYNYKQVYILGYYNITNNNNDIFTYINYKLEKLSNKYHYNYIELNNILRNNQNYLKNNQNFKLNKEGYNKISKIIVENLKNY